MRLKPASRQLEQAGRCANKFSQIVSLLNVDGQAKAWPIFSLVQFIEQRLLATDDFMPASLSLAELRLGHCELAVQNSNPATSCFTPHLSG